MTKAKICLRLLSDMFSCFLVVLQGDIDLPKFNCHLLISQRKVGIGAASHGETELWKCDVVQFLKKAAKTKVFCLGQYISLGGWGSYIACQEKKCRAVVHTGRRQL